MCKKIKSVCVCGHFGLDENLSNGQTIKTKIITDGLKRKIGDEEVNIIDTHGGAKKLLLLPFCVLKMLRKSYNMIMLPAHNGLKIITPVLFFENLIFRRKLHYIVIGGWLPEFIKNKKILSYMLKKFDGIYVKTKKMKNSLEDFGFKNVFLMPNCKDLEIVPLSELKTEFREPFNLCTFSRVMKEKGIEDAIFAVESINKKYGKTVFTLDIYGQVDEGQKQWFEYLKKSFPEYVKYKGTVSFDKSVDVLKNYFALLFPTRFFTEGIPGTIIDAYASGVPVISSKWENFDDIIEEGITGLGYEFSNVEALKTVLERIAENPEIVMTMKKECALKAETLKTENIIKILIENLGEKR